MAGKRKAPLWRQTFLRTLARTGNVRAAAFAAGVDPGTAYDHRIKDSGFAAKWAAALGKAGREKPLHRLRRTDAPHRAARSAGPRPASHARSPSPANVGEELVVRRTGKGDQLIRAGAGRWNGAAEDIFFAALGRTACVRSAAAACGFSANALYARRSAYPEFAEKWDRVLAEAKQRIPDLLAAATIASLDPEAAAGAGRRGLPKVDVDQAIRISRLNGPAGPGRPGSFRGGIRLHKPPESREELVAGLIEKLAILRKRLRKKKLAQGWSESADGDMIPPGWVFVGPKEGDGERAD